MRRNSSALCYVKEYIHCYYPKEFIHCLRYVKEYIHYYYVIDVNLFLPFLMRFLPKKTETLVSTILLLYMFSGMLSVFSVIFPVVLLMFCIVLSQLLAQPRFHVAEMRLCENIPLIAIPVQINRETAKF